MLLISPFVGFGCAAILFLVLKPGSRLLGSVGLAVILGLAAFFLFKWSLLWTAVFAIGTTAALAFGLSLIPAPESLFRAPEGTTPPPWPIRALLILTCSGVSYFHGSNDGQKGMGLIMLILIGTVPTAYALNHAVPASGVQTFRYRLAAGRPGDQQARARRTRLLGPDARAEVTQFVATKKLQPDTMIALRELVNDLSNEVALYKEYKAVPANQQTNVRNDMYVVSEAIRLMMKNHVGRFFARRSQSPERLQSPDRQGHQVHPFMGEGCRSPGTGTGHHGGLEAHRGHGWREDRQRTPDLRPGRLRGVGGHGNHLGGRLIRVAGFDNARAQFGRGGNHGGE